MFVSSKGDRMKILAYIRSPMKTTCALALMGCVFGMPVAANGTSPVPAATTEAVPGPWVKYSPTGAIEKSRCPSGTATFEYDCRDKFVMDNSTSATIKVGEECTETKVTCQ